MIVVDSSAVVAFLFGEADAEVIETRLVAARRCIFSALTIYETRTVLWGRRGPAAITEFDLLRFRLEPEIRPFDAAQADLAFAAYRRFGKGTGHPARLNLGDCAAYALATSLDLPLLFKGEDFARTDVRSALP